MTSTGNLVLVTGANGFIAAHTIIALLDGGYQVRGTVRSEKSAEIVRKTYSAYSDRFFVAVVPDLTAKNAFDEAVRDIHAVSTSIIRVLGEVKANGVGSGFAYC
jgi:nucleoside-diphosphate-sugar epimerase